MSYATKGDLTAVTVMGMGPADVGVARRVPVSENFYAHPSESVSLSRDASIPYLRLGGDVGVRDNIRYSDWYDKGKPFNFPGQNLSFTLSVKQWEDDMPMGFIRKIVKRAQIAQPKGIMARDGRRANIEPPPAYAYGSLFGTYNPGGEAPPAALPGQGGWF